MRYFLHIAYDGTQYCGWQRQADVLSVQEVLEKTLKRIFKKEVPVWGCGRTDSGVHASQYMLHINLYEDFDFDLKFRLNKNLPDDIAVHDVIPIEQCLPRRGAGRHARFDASSRTYDYFINFYKDPFLSRYCGEYDPVDLDVEAMQKAVALLIKYDDFKTICRQAHLYDNTICKVTNAQLFISDDKKRLRFTISANRFLRGMVRLCVAFLLEIGRGDLSFDEFEKIFSNKEIYSLSHTALASGLYLSKVDYPYLDIPELPGMCSSLRIGLK